MTPLVVGVTSHRNIPFDQLAPIRTRVQVFFAQLKKEYPSLPLVVLSSLAEGGDQLVAIEALAVGATLIAPLPLLRETYVGDFSSEAVRNTFDLLCDKASVLQLAPRASHQPDPVENPGLARNLAYARAGMYVASHCHILLAIWDGKDSDRLGGTAQIVHYYLNGIIPGVIDRRRDRQHLLGGGDERLLHHIVCSRNQDNGEPANGLVALTSLWRTESSSIPVQSGMPPEFRLMLSRMAEFNADAGKYADAIQTQTPSRPAGHASTANIDRLFETTDWLAIHFQKRILLAMRMTYTLAALMGIAFMSYADLPAQDYMIFVFLLLFASGAVLAMLASKRGWHRKYLDYRALAEGLRIQSYWRRAGISMTADQEFAHDNFLQKQNVELGWIRNVMRAAGLNPPSSAGPPGAAELQATINEWVGEPGVSGQLHYYERKVHERTHLHHVTEMIGAISLWGSMAISVFLAAFVFTLSQDVKTTLVSVMAVLSILAAVREAYAYRKADKELIKQYRFMQRIFSCAHQMLRANQTPAVQREILRELGETALAEHAEWTLMHRERPLEQGKL